MVVWGEVTGLRPFEDPLTQEEVQRIYRWSRDPEVLRWSGGTPTDLDLEEFTDRLNGDRKYPPGERRMFLIITREGELIGRIGCFALDWERRQGELGVVIGERKYWGQGYGRDAVKTLLCYMFQTTSLESVNLFTYVDNVRAQRCFAACGFRALGTTRRFSPDVGEFDGVEMEVTRREYLRQASCGGQPRTPTLVRGLGNERTRSVDDPRPDQLRPGRAARPQRADRGAHLS